MTCAAAAIFGSPPCQLLTTRLPLLIFKTTVGVFRFQKGSPLHALVAVVVLAHPRSTHGRFCSFCCFNILTSSAIQSIAALAHSVCKTPYVAIPASFCCLGESYGGSTPLTSTEFGSMDYSRNNPCAPSASPRSLDGDDDRIFI